MRYRVEFSLSRGPHYFTEWFDTEEEARQFAANARELMAEGVAVWAIDREDEVVA